MGRTERTGNRIEELGKRAGARGQGSGNREGQEDQEIRRWEGRRE
jgi:hypothetical protein